MVVLDTSFLIDLQEGQPQARRALQALDGDPLVVPMQAAMEFASGFEDPVQALHFLRTAFRLVMPSEEFLLAGARLRAHQRRLGRRPGWGDLHIATQAQLDGTYVVTADPGDFQALGCQTWDYRSGGARPQPPFQP